MQNHYKILITGITCCVTWAHQLGAQSPKQEPDCSIHATASTASAVSQARRPNVPSNRVDWTTLASTYTHDMQGQRVDQFAATVTPTFVERPDYLKSGYRHTRSSLQVGFNADHFHVTEQWGQGVQPYGQWRYPYRPFGAPYDQWGPQLPQALASGTTWLGQPWAAPFQGGQGPTMHPGNGTMIPPGSPTIPGQPEIDRGGPGHSGLHPGLRHPGHAYPPANGAMPWNGYPQPNGMGIQVGPWNALPAVQDEYYPQAPSLRNR